MEALQFDSRRKNVGPVQDIAEVSALLRGVEVIVRDRVDSSGHGFQSILSRYLVTI